MAEAGISGDVDDPVVIVDTDPAAVSPAAETASATPANPFWKRRPVMLGGALLALALLAVLVWLAWPRTVQFRDPSFGRLPEPAPAVAGTETGGASGVADVKSALAALDAERKRYGSQVDEWLAAARSGEPMLTKMSERVGNLDDQLQRLLTALDRVRTTAEDAAAKLERAQTDQATLRTRLEDADARVRALSEAQHTREGDLRALQDRVTKLETRLSPLPPGKAAQRKGPARTAPATVAARARGAARPAAPRIVGIEYRNLVPYAVVEVSGQTAVPVRLGSVVDGWRVAESGGGGLQLIRTGTVQ